MVCRHNRYYHHATMRATEIFGKIARTAVSASRGVINTTLIHRTPRISELNSASPPARLPVPTPPPARPVMPASSRYGGPQYLIVVVLDTEIRVVGFLIVNHHIRMARTAAGPDQEESDDRSVSRNRLDRR